MGFKGRPGEGLEGPRNQIVSRLLCMNIFVIFLSPGPSIPFSTFVWLLQKFAGQRGEIEGKSKEIAPPLLPLTAPPVSTQILHLIPGTVQLEGCFRVVLKLMPPLDLPHNGTLSTTTASELGRKSSPPAKEKMSEGEGVFSPGFHIFSPSPKRF